MEVDGTREYLPLSGIQHFGFCPRQWALIHIEQQWEENLLTFQGQDLHQKTHDPFAVEKRRDRIIGRAMPIISHQLGLQGVADVVEFEKVDEGIRLLGRTGMWKPIPVEYKLGRPKPNNCDLMQLCAQAICLEEMFSLTLDKGQIFYGKPRKRLDVTLDNELRDETERTAQRMHQTFAAGITPQADYSTACERCSLLHLCLPKLAKKRRVKDYVLQALEDE